MAYCCQRKFESQTSDDMHQQFETHILQMSCLKGISAQTFVRFHQISCNQTNSCFIIDSKALNKFHRAQGTKTLVLAALVFNSGLWVGCHSWHKNLWFSGIGQPLGWPDFLGSCKANTNMHFLIASQDTPRSILCNQSILKEISGEKWAVVNCTDHPSWLQLPLQNI